MNLTFITGNAEKAAQLSRYLDYPVRHKQLDVAEIQSLDLEEIATHKAREAYAFEQAPVLVEDTSLVFHALGSLPGPLIKWFLKSLGNDGLTRLLNGYDDRTATAEVCFALCDENGIKLFKGRAEGEIAGEPRGQEGFGWDSIFIPKGYERTWGEMTMDQQSKTSMRKIALEELQRYLKRTRSK